ncbi:MAG: bifunctional ornithine acetyltransferase/N-acetylglutamate synthase [Gemmatimonadetes bacterium 13_1_40CM_3_69_22]|nr:MAG: bifunctional ornithine acetyltransferase/N-acetylglutamate synthase [Gemmatimonadetes bacterium 13_1_40CM_3_69_22]PYO13647.1 MAG: ornithine acetyltransferase [Gemmatimonadota bacterium]
MTSAPAPPATSFEPVPDGSVTSPRGFTAAAAHAGLKTDGALDVALLVSATSCATAGVFTKNAVRAAPVIYDADLLSERPGRIRAIAMNARVANACTGPEGLAAARAMAQAAEQAAGLPPRTALVLSTGVIGVPLPVAPIAEGLRAAAAHLTAAGGTAAARAIMTTDTRPKHCAVRFETPGGIVTVGGIAKGAGMIHPDMATLLAVLTTDAVAEPATLQPLLRRVGDRSFNAISVDGDTSTNDTALLLANGASGVDPGRDGAVWKLFEEAVQHVARALALAIVEDGEGASKLVEIQVVGAASEASAREVGRAIARSTLVKTAIYGADPNWGRILAAAGAAGVALAVERLTLQAAVNGEWLTLAQGGATAHPDPERAHAIFRQKTIRLRIDLGLGRAEAVVWTCDLTPDYVRINADYTS